LAGDLRVVGSNSGRSFQAIFDPRLPKKFQKKFPVRSISVPLIVDFTRPSIEKLNS